MIRVGQLCVVYGMNNYRTQSVKVVAGHNQGWGWHTGRDDADAGEMLDLWIEAMLNCGFQEMSIRRAINRKAAESILEACGTTGC